MAEKLLITTIVYGEYVEIFDEICLRSLFQSGNIPWLIAQDYDLEYIIYTKEEDTDRVNEVVDKWNREGLEFTVNAPPDMDNNNALHEIIDKGIENDCQVFFLNPDYFYGNESLRNLISYKFKNKMCLASLHVRVNADEFADKIKTIKGELSNAQLASISMKCLHKSWGESFISNDINNSHTSGSAIQQISNNLWAITFRIPTVFLAKFEDSDRQALQRFDLWDHEWPTELVRQHRFKFVGSSDIFYAVELTKREDNIPRLAGNMVWNDEFHSNKEHGEINRNFLIIVRGQDD